MIANEHVSPAYLADAPESDASEAHRSVPPGAPLGWDYHTVVIPQSAIGGHRDEVDRGQLERELAELGLLGWELMHVSFNARMHLERDGHLMIFKRPVYAAPAREPGAGEFLPGMD